MVPLSPTEFYLTGLILMFKTDGKYILVNVEDDRKLTIHSRMFEREMIIPHSNTGWGEWWPPEFCPDNSFAKGFELKVSIFILIYY